jgi:hypothetical protein
VARSCALTVTVGALGALQLVVAGPASAVTGIQKVVKSVTDSQSSKSVTATCPVGKRVIGGGGWVYAAGADATKVTLTQLQPIHPSDGSPDKYVATGAETEAVNTGWNLQAYALCADIYALYGHEIVAASTSASSASVQATAAVCPSGKRVLGVGGTINNPGNQVGLQVVRASDPGDIARVQAHEDADGYSGSWSVTSYAICAVPPVGYETVYGHTVEPSKSEVVVYARCPGAKRLHGVGAAVTNTSSGSIWLQVVYPFDDLQRVEGVAVKNGATSETVDVVVQAICAN